MNPMHGHKILRSDEMDQWYLKHLLKCWKLPWKIIKINWKLVFLTLMSSVVTETAMPTSEVQPFIISSWSCSTNQIFIKKKKSLCFVQDLCNYFWYVGFGMSLCLMFYTFSIKIFMCNKTTTYKTDWCLWAHHSHQPEWGFWVRRRHTS